MIQVIKIGQKKYSVFKKHCLLEEKKSSIINDDNYNKNKNNISSINKKSKPIFNFDIKSDQYIINNNKNEQVKEINRQQIKCSNENKNDFRPCVSEDFEIINLNQKRNEKRYFTENENKNEIIYESEGKYETSNKSENRCITEKENENEYEYSKCKICNNSDSDINNPLICLCNCCHHQIHYECLKEHLKSKIIISENLKKTVTTYRCEKFNCDKCLKPYYLRFRIPEFDKTYELIDLTLPEETDYICLESLDYIKDNNNIKTLHIVKLEDQEITIGSQESNDIIDYDISESTDYAVLRYNKSNGNLFLENKSEKFDTLVLVRGNVKITEEKTFFQIGNIKLSMKLIPSKLKKDAIYSDNSSI